jgi:outer membrane protein
VSSTDSANEGRSKRQRTAALQDLAERVARAPSRQRLGVRLSSAAFAAFARTRHSVHWPHAAQSWSLETPYVRPDLLRFRNERDASLRFAKAERAARFPTISAVGSAGVIPIHDPALPDNYAAAGLTLNLPLFAGGLYAARQKEAELRARAADESLRDAENNAIRDVRIAWLNARNAYDRLSITSQLLENAKRSFSLAQARYTNGASSIVELNQAQLNEISADIEYANTKYEYLLRLSALNFQTGSLR